VRRFRFRLEALTQVLKQATREKRLALVDALDRADAAHAEVLDLEAARARAIDVGRLAEPRFDVAGRQALNDYLDDSARALAQAGQALDGCTRAVDAARQAVQRARVEAARMERLRELHQERHRKESTRQEMVRIDEIAARRGED